MTRSTFRVQFFANGSKEKNGIVPIMGRVTINGTVAQFSSKELWTQRETVPKAKAWRQGKRTLRSITLKRKSSSTTTAQYYRDLKRQTGVLEANVRQLQTEQRQAEWQLDEVRKEIKSEKLEAAKTEAKTALMAKVGSLLGSGKLKAEREELQQRISTLESQNKELVRHIETMEREHQSERTKFNEYMEKIQRHFPHVEMLLPLIDFCRNTLKFSERVIQELCKEGKVER